MKTKNQNNDSYLKIFLLQILMISLFGIAYAQVSIKPLESAVNKTISGYYDNNFNVSADQTGKVTIKGEVNTLFDKLKIGEIISQVDHVSGINNKLEVIVDQPTADAMIKANIEEEFQLNNVILEPEKIIVDVKNGVVNMSGTVSTYREKIMAQSIASWQDGVIDMTSSMKVLLYSSEVSDQNLKELITDILNKHFFIEKNIKFDVKDGTVNIYGTAKNLYAIDHFQEEIQHLLGVKNITNEIVFEKNY